MISKEYIDEATEIVTQFYDTSAIVLGHIMKKAKTGMTIDQQTEFANGFVLASAIVFLARRVK